jgi:hypothetical protein
MLRSIMKHTNRISKIRYDKQDTDEISVYSGKTCNPDPDPGGGGG